MAAEPIGRAALTVSMLVPPLSTSATLLALLLWAHGTLDGLWLALLLAGSSLASAAAVRRAGVELAELSASLADQRLARVEGGYDEYSAALQVEAAARQLGLLWPLMLASAGLAGLAAGIIAYYLTLRLVGLSGRVCGNRVRAISLPAFSTLLVASAGFGAALLYPLLREVHGALHACTLQGEDGAGGGGAASLHLPSSKPGDVEDNGEG